MKKRSILISMLVIGVVAALIAAATTATFSDQVTSSSNTFKAGTLYMSVDGACGTRTATAGQYGTDGTTPVGATSGGLDAGPNNPCSLTTAHFTATGMYPGASVNHNYPVVNKGSLNGDLTVTNATVTTDNETACPGATNFTVALTGATQTINAGQTAGPVPNVQVTMNQSAGNPCQGVTATVNLNFHLVQSATQPAPTVTIN